MLEINLCNKYVTSPLPFGRDHRLIDLKLCSGGVKELLRTIITYRNSPTGAGHYWGGTYVPHKMRAGYRTVNLSNIEILILELEGVSRRALAVLKRILDNIARIEEGLKIEVRPAINRVTREIFDKYGRASQKADAEIKKAILPYEYQTLDAINLIDTEIDSFLRVFGLTRRSEI